MKDIVQRLISRRRVKDITTLSLSEIDRKENAGKFPRRVRLSDNPRGRCAYIESEVLDWIAKRIAHRSSPR